MRKLIIILAVFVLLFVVVLVWGVARDREPPRPGKGQPINCNGLPLDDNGDVDTDRMEEWKAYCIGDRGKAFEGKGRGIRLNPASLQVTSDPRDWPVPQAKDGESAQQVKLSIASPALIKVDALPADGDVDRQSVCLCSGRFDQKALDRCDADWRNKKDRFSDVSGGQNAKATCSENSNAAKLFFGPLGGSIKLEALAGNAEVTSAR